MGIVGLGRGFIGDLQLKAGSQTKNQLDDSGRLARGAARLCRRHLGARVKTSLTIRGASREYAARLCRGHLGARVKTSLTIRGASREARLAFAEVTLAHA